MAIVMQVVAARLGIVTGKDLAQACRDLLPGLDALAATGSPARWPSPPATWPRCWAAPWRSTCLFHIPLFWAVLITAFDVLLLLALQGLGMRFIEAVILVLVATIGVCYFVEIFVLPQTQPEFLGDGPGPARRRAFARQGMIVVAIGIIGATVMPHNLYLHSALVQSRQIAAATTRRSAGRSGSTRIDTVLALSVAFLVNAAILVLAAMVFHGQDSVTLAGGEVVHFNEDTDWIRDGLPDAGAAAGDGGGQHPVRRGAAGQRAEQHDHRHAGRPGGHGRVHALAHRPWVRRLVTRAAGHRAGGPHHRPARRRAA